MFPFLSQKNSVNVLPQCSYKSHFIIFSNLSYRGAFYLCFTLVLRNYDIWSFDSCVSESSNLLRCYAVSTCIEWQTSELFLIAEWNLMVCVWAPGTLQLWDNLITTILVSGSLDIHWVNVVWKCSIILNQKSARTGPKLGTYFQVAVCWKYLHTSVR